MNVFIFNVVLLIQIPPTDAELSCILDHLEIAGDSPKLWATLSLELEAENSQRTETYWEKVRCKESLEELKTTTKLHFFRIFQEFPHNC